MKDGAIVEGNITLQCCSHLNVLIQSYTAVLDDNVLAIYVVVSIT